MSAKSSLQAERGFPSKTDRVARPREKSSNGGALIINADDWGRDNETTQRILECTLRGSVSSVSAMVFMEDSERAAEIARERGIDAGLHLNLTTPFSGTVRDKKLIAQQERLSRYLGRHRLASALFHPGLAGPFKYVVQAQLEEFSRIYGEKPKRIDGHHHMHLCANVLLGGLLPEGTNVRRNFSFAPGEKSLGNRLYRKIVDRILARRHHITDYFFSLTPIEPQRIEKIFSLVRQFTVEVETHPVNPEEYGFLLGGELLGRLQVSG
jgi:predicted glycoside hydrolase/deacetylase ChbG (UPF0249 family)